MSKKSQKSSAKILRQNEFSLKKEANYIVRQAQLRDARVVQIGPLVFFSTETGDAWLLDPQDGLSLCLAESGERQSYVISETGANFTIEWNSEFYIGNNTFTVSYPSGKVKTITGYPLEALLKSIGSILAGGGSLE